MIDLLQQLQLCASVKGLSLKVNYKGFTVHDLKKYLQIVKLNLLRVIVDVDIHLFSRLQATFLGFNVEDALLENVSLESLILSGFTWVSPWFHSNLIVVWHFEGPL